MAIDTHTKRRASLAVGLFSLVLPLADGTDAGSIADRGHVSYIYAANIVQTNAVAPTGRLRALAGHAFHVEAGHEFAVRVGHEWRVVELK